MANSRNVIELDDGNFDAEVLAAEGPVLVDFTAKWCGPCKALAPILESIAAENAGSIKVVKIDVNDSPRVTERYGIRSMPTRVVFRGGERRAQHVGLTTKQKLLSMVGSAG